MEFVQNAKYVVVYTDMICSGSNIKIDSIYDFKYKQKHDTFRKINFIYEWQIYNLTEFPYLGHLFSVYWV